MHHRPASTIPGPTRPLLSAEELPLCGTVRRRAPHTAPGAAPAPTCGKAPARRDTPPQRHGGTGSARKQVEQGHGTAQATAYRTERQRLVRFAAVETGRGGVVGAGSGVRGGTKSIVRGGDQCEGRGTV